MRVIAGEFRSRVLVAPQGLATRPTSDRLRETLFNVLAPRIVGSRFLDLYAGSGAVGIEALSRGAAEVVFVERAAPAVKMLRENLKQLGIRDRFRVQAAGAATYLRSSTGIFDLVFLDPPYDAAEEYAGTLGLLGGSRSVLVAEGAVVVAEHRRKERLEDQYRSLKRSRLLEQGDATLSFYSHKG
jgi:16S rRNA (guanine(966)-N(2))-methyltransferase RsmD